MVNVIHLTSFSYTDSYYVMSRIFSDHNCNLELFIGIN